MPHLECFHNGIILIVICFLISVTKIVIYFVLMSNLWKNINIFDEL